MFVPVSEHPPFDGREATRMTFYYQCLLVLGDILHLTSSRLPSQQPIPYYRLLLRGLPVEPDLGNRVYALQWNRNKSTKVHQLEPLEDFPPDPPIAGGGEDDDEQFIALLPGMAQPKLKAHGGHGSRGRGRGRGRSSRGQGRAGSSGDPPPLPPPDPLPPQPPGGPGLAPLPPGGGHGDPPGAPPPPVLGGPDDETFVAAPVGVKAQAAVARNDNFDTGWFDGLQGSLIRFMDYQLRDGSSYPNWKIKCNRDHLHSASCEKTCGMTPANQRHFCKIEPLAVLGAWAATCESPRPGGKASHALENPSKQAVATYAREHQQELEDIISRVGL